MVRDWRRPLSAAATLSRFRKAELGADGACPRTDTPTGMGPSGYHPSSAVPSMTLTLT